MNDGDARIGMPEGETDAFEQQLPLDGQGRDPPAKGSHTPLATSVEKAPANSATVASSGDRKLVSPTRSLGRSVLPATVMASCAKSAQAMDTLASEPLSCTASDSQEQQVEGRYSSLASSKETRSTGWTAPCSSTTLTTWNVTTNPMPMSQEQDWLVCGESPDQLLHGQQDPPHPLGPRATPDLSTPGQNGKSSDTTQNQQAQSLTQNSSQWTPGAMEEQKPQQQVVQAAMGHDEWEECNSAKSAAARQ